ncbi:EamA family transporter [Neisseriaceae bacterium ESL0693]|nr:EamA family transporter [Neisseriaceae bacterium ESL0693]
MQDCIFATIVIVVWGINFMFIQFALAEVSPLVLGILRFCLILFPAIFFIPKPAIRWHWLLLYGTLLSFGQFSLLFGAISVGLSTGLAALLLQSQAFFTIFIAALLWHEPIKLCQWLAIMIAMIGLILIGIGQQDTQLSVLGVFLVLGAALSWAAGNALVKYIGPTAPLPLVVWGNVISLILFTLAACWHDGFRQVGRQIAALDGYGWLAVAYLSYGATFVGYGLWGILLSRYAATRIAPLTLFVPVVAIMMAFLFLHEHFNYWQWAGVGVLMLSLVVQIGGSRLMKRTT